MNLKNRYNIDWEEEEEIIIKFYGDFNHWYFSWSDRPRPSQDDSEGFQHQRQRFTSCLEPGDIPGHLKKREIFTIQYLHNINIRHQHGVSPSRIYHSPLALICHVCGPRRDQYTAGCHVLSLSLSLCLPARYKKLFSSLVECFMMTSTGLDWLDWRTNNKERKWRQHSVFSWRLLSLSASELVWSGGWSSLAWPWHCSWYPQLSP